ncbi:hypothetical protein Tco_1288829, partial [Tanacetum coccineum]
TAALIDVNATQSKLVLLENFNENYSKCLRLLVCVVEEYGRSHEDKKLNEEIESFKSSTQHSSVNDFVVIDIPEEDVEPKQIILDPDDQPMWEIAKTVAPTPNSAIVQINVDDNFVINNTHMKMICENKFDGYLRADPHDQIREFLSICNMFKYGETQSEAVKILIFPFSLCDKAKTWFNELNEESIISTQEHASKIPWAWSDQMSYYSNILSRSRQTHSRNPGRNNRRNLPLQKSKSIFSIS